MTPPRREAGYALVALVAAITVMLILMAAAMPSWKWVVMSDREEELFFRGDSIATAIERFQKKNGNAMPTSLDQLVKGKYLRRAYLDPMTPEGKWRFLRPGEVNVPRPTGGRRPRERPRDRRRQGEAEESPTPAPSAAPEVGMPGTPGTIGGSMGPFVGVATTLDQEGYKLMNGKENYREWFFVAGQPRGFGKLVLPSGPPGVPPPPNVPVPPGGNRDPDRGRNRDPDRGRNRN